MATVSTTLTVEEFYEWASRPENAHRWFELERGEPVELPPPGERLADAQALSFESDSVRPPRLGRQRDRGGGLAGRPLQEAAPGQAQADRHRRDQHRPRPRLPDRRPEPRNRGGGLR